MEEEERELIPVPVRRREIEREKENQEFLSDQELLEPREIPRRWYAY